ncbi:hypothetical protein FHT77_005750 [Rhizobium sp. BK181]|nr:hypothetical protein [Rhizobium sp. BK181]
MDISAVLLSRIFLLPTPYFRTFPGRNPAWPISPCMAKDTSVHKLERRDGMWREKLRAAAIVGERDDCRNGVLVPMEVPRRFLPQMALSRTSHPQALQYHFP